MTKAVKLYNELRFWKVHPCTRGGVERSFYCYERAHEYAEAEAKRVGSSGIGLARITAFKYGFDQNGELYLVACDLGLHSNPTGAAERPRDLLGTSVDNSKFTKRNK